MRWVCRSRLAFSFPLERGGAFSPYPFLPHSFSRMLSSRLRHDAVTMSCSHHQREDNGVICPVRPDDAPQWLTTVVMFNRMAEVRRRETSTTRPGRDRGGDKERTGDKTSPSSGKRQGPLLTTWDGTSGLHPLPTSPAGPPPFGSASLW